ncbi:uncharacterized protein [Cardiocondyla obscurior]|uniref:uncharacterized protein n=1 Tax=Cardiocondyla obscurior TaxID=286306 RepID=UPI0039657744
MLLILSLVLKHNLTGTSIADIITVINLHCPNQDLKKNSLYKFKKYFSWSTEKFTKHYYCSVCTTSLITKKSICKTCQTNTRISYFIEMPFLKELELMFQRKNFRELLLYRFQREGGLRFSSFRDIYDGSLYQQYVHNGFLSNPNNISFTWYTDGIPIFKSSHISIWPVYLTINELPYKHRIKKENIVLVGLWFGSNKPSANHFMYKFRSQFRTLLQGLVITLSRQNIITVRGIVLAGTCDLPAKAQFLNMMQYNGEFGCNHCKDKGESFTHPITWGTSRVYSYNKYPIMRTSVETIENGNQALQDKKSVNGVKGPCALSKLMSDFINGTAIDYMHCIFSGVVKKLLYFWLDSNFSNEPFSLRAISSVVDSRLTCIKPPKFVHRMPRTVLDLCHWKASELKMWFFYYSVPILEKIMNPIYFRHYLLLVNGISLLNSSCITVKNIEDAERLLHEFVRECPTLYGIQFCSINVHQILHLPDCVKRLGPLWIYSCFPYEDINGKILKLVHGTTHIESQIASAHIF